MTQKQKDEAILKRDFIINRASGICEHLDENGNRDCEEPGVEVAHCISKSKMNIRKYGYEYVHHPKVLRWSCKEHNDSFNIGFKPAVIAEELAKIDEAGIENWGKNEY